MKKYITTLALVTASAAFFAGCTSTSDGLNVEASAPDGKFYKEEISSNNTETHFRAVGYGKSPNKNTARGIATNSARANLATKIKATMTGSIKSEETQTTSKVSEDEARVSTETATEFYKSVVETAVNQILVNLNEFNVLLQRPANGDYDYTVGVEMAKADVQKAVEKQLATAPAPQISPEMRASLQEKAKAALAAVGK